MCVSKYTGWKQQVYANQSEQKRAAQKKDGEKQKSS